MDVRTRFMLPLALAATLMPLAVMAQGSSPDPNAPAQNQYALKQEEAQNRSNAKASKGQAKASKKAAKADKNAAKKESKVESSQRKAAEANDKANPQ